jgi:archaellum component FlaC
MNTKQMSTGPVTKQDLLDMTAVLITHIDTVHGDLSEQIETVAMATSNRFDAMDERFNAIDDRFDIVDKRLGKVEKRLDSIEHVIEKAGLVPSNFNFLR